METRQRNLASWLLLSLLAVLCLALAVLQYRWIGAISLADQERVRENLQRSLDRFAMDWSKETGGVLEALVPTNEAVENEGMEAAYAARYRQWRARAEHPRMLLRVALAVPRDSAVALLALNLENGSWSPMEWPAEWNPLREWTEHRGLDAGPGPGMPPNIEDRLVTEIPRFGRPAEPPSRERARFGEANWLVVEFDPDYIIKSMIPAMLERQLGAIDASDYRAQINWRAAPSRALYHSGDAFPVQDADASVVFFDPALRRGPGGGPGGPGPGMMPGPGPSPGPGPGAGRGRLILSLRHRAGSLEAVVRWHRLRNLAVSGAIILLMAASAAMLFRLSRQTQQLADLQMRFVAGVSHELRTPLTVIRTAAFNLRGKIATNPAQVERYGSLIQNESEKLTAIVEQVLRFAGARAGQVVRQREPVPVTDVIEDAIQSCRSLFEGNRYVLEKNTPDDLPLIMGDSMALQHAFQNLIHNAVKYGTEGSNWIGVSASAPDAEHVEIRIEDRGPGIPKEEQQQIFEPFFRGQRAVQDQIHGTGLGLNLVKQIVEAHGGSIRVESETMKGTAFVIQLPIAPAEHQDEFANTVSRG